MKHNISLDKFGNNLAIIIIIFFVVITIIRLYFFPPHDTIGQILADAGNDWVVYADHALDIKKNGIWMPNGSGSGPYFYPGGFLYCYFLALLFILFGDNTIPVFVAQGAMLGISIALFYWTVKNKMRPLTGILFLITLTIWGLVDVFKHYSFKFLSENLAIFTLALAFFFFVKGLEKKNNWFLYFSSFFTGLGILVRPNLLFSGIVFILLIGYFFLKNSKHVIKNLVLVSVFFSLGMSFLSIRNYVITGKIYTMQTVSTSGMASVNGVITVLKIVLPIPEKYLRENNGSRSESPLYNSSNLKTIVSYINYMSNEPGNFFGIFFKRALFCFGNTTVLVPDYKNRPHWMVMWIAYFAFLIWKFKYREKTPLWEMAFHSYIVSYYALMFIFGNVGNYGFRLLIHSVQYLLPFSFLLLDKVSIKYSKNNKQIPQQAIFAQ
ncbi:MAG: glycosyltransferase family 39 protein [Oligoflexia bacterium]|nr:glycosyltransferase family 39 protein [Oligoflexia bacterium]